MNTAPDTAAEILASTLRESIERTIQDAAADGMPARDIFNKTRDALVGILQVTPERAAAILRLVLWGMVARKGGPNAREVLGASPVAAVYRVAAGY